MTVGRSRGALLLVTFLGFFGVSLWASRSSDYNLFFYALSPYSLPFISLSLSRALSSSCLRTPPPDSLRCLCTISQLWCPWHTQ